MTCCTYDNPETMARECWQDGRLLCKYDAELLLSRSPIPREYLFFGANIGPWKEGQLWGDPAAMKSEVRAHVEAYARANINVATAAKDAEIEVLRAEVDRLSEALRKLEERAQRDEALLRQALEALEILRTGLIQMRDHAESYGEAWARAYVKEYRELLPGSAEEHFHILNAMQRRLAVVADGVIKGFDAIAALRERLGEKS